MRIVLVVGSLVLLALATVLFLGIFEETDFGDEATGPGAPRVAEPADETVDDVSPAPAGDPIPRFDVVRVEEDGSAVAAGRAMPGAEVSLLTNGEVAGSAVANERGEWVIVVPDPLPPGNFDVTLSARNPDGSERASEERVVVAVPQDPAREPLVVMTEPGKGSRVLQGSGIVAEDSTLLLESLDYDAVGNLIIAGRSEPGVEITVYAGDRLLGRARAGEDGRWELTPDVPLPPGYYTLRVEQYGEDGTAIASLEAPFERAAPEDAVALRNGQIVIQPGNNLWFIARRLYGSGLKYTVIYQANREKIRDPNLIYPGQVFTAPEPCDP